MRVVIRKNLKNRVKDENSDKETDIKNDLCSNVLLDVAQKSFEHEHDRTKRIEGKANMCIVIIGIIFTLLVGYLDLKYPNDIWKYICGAIFAISIASYLVSLIYFLKVLKPTKYKVLKYELVFSEDNLKCYKKDMEESLVGEYKKMLVEIKKSNEEKACFYDVGTKSTAIGVIFSFILIFIDFLI